MRLCLLFVAYEIVRKENAHQTESQTTETISKAKAQKRNQSSTENS